MIETNRWDKNNNLSKEVLCITAIFKKSSSHCFLIFLQDEKLWKDIQQELDDETRPIAEKVRSSQTITLEEGDYLSDAVNNALEYDKCILDICWDGDAPGMSGILQMLEYKGYYFVYSSDLDPDGPFPSLEEALGCGYFHPTAKPQLSSDCLPFETLLELAKNLVEWQDGWGLWINSEYYVVQGDDLVKVENPD